MSPTTPKAKAKSRKDIVAKHKEFLLPSLGSHYADPLPFVSGKGVHLTDADGKEYLDFFGGIVTVSVGHCDEEITERIVDQLRTLQHTSTLFPIEAQADLAEKLAAIAPGDLKRSFPGRSSRTRAPRPTRRPSRWRRPTPDAGRWWRSAIATRAARPVPCR